MAARLNRIIVDSLSLTIICLQLASAQLQTSGTVIFTHAPEGASVAHRGYLRNGG